MLRGSLVGRNCRPSGNPRRLSECDSPEQQPNNDTVRQLSTFLVRRIHRFNTCSLYGLDFSSCIIILSLLSRHNCDAQIECRHALSAQSRRLSQVAGQRTHSTPRLPSSNPIHIIMSVSCSSPPKGSAPFLHEHFQETSACDFGTENGSRLGKDDGILQDGKTQC